MGKHITKRHRQSTWSMEKPVTCKHANGITLNKNVEAVGQWRKRLCASVKAKGHHFEHLLN